jgi:hypothetical protein
MRIWAKPKKDDGGPPKVARIFFSLPFPNQGIILFRLMFYFLNYKDIFWFWNILSNRLKLYLDI